MHLAWWQDLTLYVLASVVVKELWMTLGLPSCYFWELSAINQILITTTPITLVILITLLLWVLHISLHHVSQS